MHQVLNLVVPLWLRETRQGHGRAARVDLAARWSPPAGWVCRRIAPGAGRRASPASSPHQVSNLSSMPVWNWVANEQAIVRRCARSMTLTDRKPDTSHVHCTRVRIGAIPDPPSQILQHGLLCAHSWVCDHPFHACVLSPISRTPRLPVPDNA